MQAIITDLAVTIITVLVVVVGAIGSAVLVKGREALKSAKHKDELGIIDIVTERMAGLVEAEFKGAQGEVKLQKALALASDVLARKGIKVSEEEIRAGIEEGVRKLPKEFKFNTTTSIDGNTSVSHDADSIKLMASKAITKSDLK